MTSGRDDDCPLSRSLHPATCSALLSPLSLLKQSVGLIGWSRTSGCWQMNTALLLMAQYGGKAIIPIDDVCWDYFSHLTSSKLVRKISAGEIALPLVRIEDSQKCAKGIHLADLARYLKLRTEAARKEMRGLTE